jgi:hypothetical protein
MRQTALDKQWHHLMSLCEKEKEYSRQQGHPKLLRLITEQINQIAADMGFSKLQIHRREFRAEKQGESIIRIITK